MAQQTDVKGRRVAAIIALSLDGRVNGLDGEKDMGWIVPHAETNGGRDLTARMTKDSATTALLGRKNYEGFGGFWPAVAEDDNANPRDRAFAKWIDSVEKVVFTTTLTEAPWRNSRISELDPVEEARRLRGQDGGDIVVLNSASVINALLAAGELDRLGITLCPELVGGGDRLFDDGLPSASWSLADQWTSRSGAVCLIYDRIRDER